jgi:lysophospholipid acyltransferase (LPLAT)-like uncharacterized protein
MLKNEAPVEHRGFVWLVKSSNRYNQFVSSTAQSENMPARNKPKPFTLRQRIALWLIANVGTLLIRIIGSTLRYEVSSEDEVADPASLPESSTVAPFWHRAVFSAVYFFQRRGIAVMTSRSYDGEYIARIISNFGFIPVRGSSSRGAVSALLGMKQVIEDDGVAAFTIDGPRGPIYIAKPGPVLLAKKTDAPIRCFYVAVSHGWTLGSWDKFVIPRPFAKAYIRWSSKITVPAEAGEGEMTALHSEMQTALERVRDFAQNAVGSQL